MGTFGGLPFFNHMFMHSEFVGLCHPFSHGCERGPATLEGDLQVGGAIVFQCGAHRVVGVGRGGNSFSLPLSHTH